MNRTTRLKLILTGIVLPLIVAGCFSSNPTRQGNDDRTGTGTGGTGTEGNGNPTSTGTNSGSGQSSSDGTLGGHRGAPDSPNTPQTGTFGLPQAGSKSGKTDKTGKTNKTGKSGDRDGSSDIQVATADKSSTDGNASDASDGDIGGSTLPEQPEVTVAEALEGANAAVDAAADAVAEAEATIARAKEDSDADAGGGGDEDTFDPWAEAGSKDGNESGKPDGGDQSDSDSDQDGDTESPGQWDDDENESFDPFANSDDEDDDDKEDDRLIPRSDSLQTADDAVAAARAALNRARRSLIQAAGSGAADDDPDAQAVQLGAARAAMQAAAEAVIASAIAVMAASDAFADENSDFSDEDAEAAQDRLAEGIAMVVAITERDMKNAAEALDATGELLSAAGSLIGMLGKPEQQQDESDDDGMEGAERVASLEKQLDQSLSVFDDRMEVESRNVGGTVSGDDSEITGLALPEGADRNSGSRNTSPTRTANDGSAVRTQETVNPDIKARYDTPAGMTRTETEQIVIAEGRAQDDDIVARQLREAAMAETDPELREALWKEYKSYKESLESGEADANQ